MMRVGRVVVVLSSMLLLLGASSCRQRKLERWAWAGEELSGPDIPFTCTSALRGTAIHLDCKDLPAETTVTIGGKEHAATSPFHAEVDVGDALGATLLSDLARPGFELDPRAPLVIATPRGTVTTELPKVKNVTSGLVHGVGKPMRFGNEPPAVPNPAGPTALWLEMEREAFGPGQTLRDVDWVASEGERTIVAGPTCKYQDRQTGAVSTAPLSVHAVEAVIHDRRTGRVVDRTLFKPEVSCPVEKLKEQDAVHAAVSQDAMKRWVARRRAQP